MNDYEKMCFLAEFAVKFCKQYEEPLKNIEKCFCPGGFILDEGGVDDVYILCLNFDKEFPRLVVFVDCEEWAELPLDNIQHGYDICIETAINWGGMSYNLCKFGG